MFVKKQSLAVIGSIFMTVFFVALMTGCGPSNTQQSTSGTANSSSTDGSAGKGTPGKDFKVAVLTIRKLTTPADLSTLEGIDRLKKEFNMNVKIVECTEISEYKEQVQAVSEEGYNVVYFIYDNFLPAVKELAPKYPNTKYIGLWIDLPKADQLPNLKPLFFKPEEGSYLSGVVAAMMTKTKKVGFIAGGINPGILTFLAGYEAESSTSIRRSNS